MPKNGFNSNNDIKEDTLILCRGMLGKMNKLRFLEINDGRITRLPQDIDYLPNGLRWLEWWHYPAQCLPESFQPGIQENITALNELVLASTPIKCLPWSMGNASRLQKLQLLKCKNVVTLPNSLFRLPYLEELNLGGLEGLRYFTDDPQPSSPQWKRKMNQLIISETSGVQCLLLSGCIMVEALPHIPSSIKILKMDHCVSLTIPSLLKLLEKCKNLQYLSLERCYQYLVNQYDIPVSLFPLWDWVILFHS
ncbi:hypothetical protein LIER_04259 [Lithospermum erythrorhizon]|uniref:Uncharacterized protein n=1 Tax=Lithospermum erythrorhizon TaxID=34254 RepID=A0AAV3P0V4_LITER